MAIVSGAQSIFIGSANEDIDSNQGRAAKQADTSTESAALALADAVAVADADAIALALLRVGAVLLCDSKRAERVPLVALPAGMQQRTSAVEAIAAASQAGNADGRES